MNVLFIIKQFFVRFMDFEIPSVSVFGHFPYLATFSYS